MKTEGWLLKNGVQQGIDRAANLPGLVQALNEYEQARGSGDSWTYDLIEKEAGKGVFPF